MICRGARATEDRLLAEVDALRPRSVGRLGGAPVRIVVPSGSLRLHVCRRIAHERGAMAGVVVQTLHGSALEILGRSGRPAPLGNAAFSLLARRLARRSPVLRASLDDLAEGYEPVVPVLSDLLDAGFVPALEEAVLERVEELSGAVGRARAERARALVGAAALTADLLEDEQAWPVNQASRLAEDALREDGPGAFPARAVIVHGFADLTGVAADLLSAMLAVLPGVVLVDRPPDPAGEGEEDRGVEFLRRLEDRFGGLDRSQDGAASLTPFLELAHAPDVDAEARWVAEEVRGLVVAGVVPEEIGIVARRLDGVAPALRRHLGRLGVPFSGCGARLAGGGLQRRLRRVAELLAGGPESDVDLWFEAHGKDSPGLELRLALRVLGALRVRDVSELDPRSLSGGGVRLPVDLRADGEEHATGSSPRIDARVLRRLAREVETLVNELGSWPDEATAAEHARRTARVLESLGWVLDSDVGGALERCVVAAARELPAALRIDRGEWLRTLGGHLEEATTAPLGGRGGGVQVLEAMESRARTFGHLFLMDLERGVFPATVKEDPLLPEAVRARLAADVLPEMPVKARSADEERYLFAQLLSSAPRVRLSWHEGSDGGPMAPSSFVERLRSRRPDMPAPTRVAGWPGLAEEGRVPRRALCGMEHGVLAGLVRPREGLAPWLELAISDGRERRDGRRFEVAPAELAWARLAVVDVAESTPAPGRVGPWAGFVSPAWVAADRALAVTTVEGTARCPLRTFITRRLGVMPMPDPQLGLPGLDPPLVGQVVHRVLEQVALDHLASAPGSVDEARGASAVTVPWPGPERLEEILLDAAADVARRQGLAVLGLGRLLAARARPVLEVARSVDWSRGEAEGVLAAELPGELVAGGLRLSFRADRVDAAGDDLTLVDYKVGAPLSAGKKASTRQKAMLDAVARGRVLQGAAYALAAGGTSVGRYLWLKPDGRLEPEVRSADVGATDAGIADAFLRAVAVVHRGHASGVAFPRLEEPGEHEKTPSHCTWCPVAEACRRDDSRFRRLLVAWMEAGDDAGDAEAVAAARELWWLGHSRQEDVT